MLDLLLFPILGVVAGLIAGLFGVGGGLIIVPALVHSFMALGYAEQSLTHLAVGTSLATIILTSGGSIYQHNKQGNIMWPVFRWLAIGMLLGAFLGAHIADWISGRNLQILLGAFAVLVAVQMWFGLRPAAARSLPAPKGIILAGIIIGIMSAIFGIGGGSLTVPFLVWCNQEMKRAVGTSAAGGLPIAVAGTLGFIVTGWGDETLPAYSIGYVYLPALFGIVLTSILFARVGANLASRLPEKRLKQAFALMSLAIGLNLLF